MLFTIIKLNFTNDGVQEGAFRKIKTIALKRYFTLCTNEYLHARNIASIPPSVSTMFVSDRLTLTRGNYRRHYSVLLNED